VAKGPNWQTRERATQLMYQQSEEGRARLTQMTQTGALPERVAAALRLAQNGSEQAAELMDREFLGGRRSGFYPWTYRGNRRLGNAARINIWKLAKQCPEAAGPLVEGIYLAGPPKLKKAALRILARQRQADFLPALRQCLGSGRPRVGEVAREAFWQMLRLGETALPTALAMLESSDWLERKAAVCLLRRWGKLTQEQ